MNCLQIIFVSAVLALVTAVNGALPDAPSGIAPLYQAPNSLTTPRWLVGHEDLLPHATIEQVREVVNLLNYRSIVSAGYEGADVPAALTPTIQQALSRINELGPNIVPSLLWLFAADQDSFPPGNRYQAGSIMEILQHDGTIAPEVTPLFRQRLEWVTSELERGNLDAPFDPRSVNLYLLLWGTDEDRAAIGKQLQLMKEKAPASPALSDVTPRLLEGFKSETDPQSPLYMHIRNFHRKTLRTVTQSLLGQSNAGPPLHWPPLRSERQNQIENSSSAQANLAIRRPISPTSRESKNTALSKTSISIWWISGAVFVFLGVGALYWTVFKRTRR